MAGSDRRLQELILYVAERSEGDRRFGKTKLNKILFYVDFVAHRDLGQSITGQEYRKLPFGPVASGVEPALTRLEEAGDLVIRPERHSGYPQQRPLAVRRADPNVFSGAEIALIDEIIAELWDHSARDVSDLSHDFIGWKAAESGAVIPYDTVCVNIEGPTDEDLEYARKLVAEGR